MSFERLAVPQGSSRIHAVPSRNPQSYDPDHDPPDGLGSLVEHAIAQTSEDANQLEQISAELQEGLIRFRDLLRVYQETKTSVERNSQIIQRASEAGVPDAQKEIEEAKVLSERVSEKLSPIHERAANQRKVYEYERRRASAASAQLEWYAASWVVKLRKVLLGEVEGKRMKLLRIAAPFVLGFAMLLLVGFTGRLLLEWGVTVYYKKF